MSITAVASDLSIMVSTMQSAIVLEVLLAGQSGEIEDEIIRIDTAAGHRILQV